MPRLDSITNLGQYFLDINKIPRLELEEETLLIERAYEGDETARDRLVHGYLWFVVLVAQVYSAYGLPLLDLIAEGNIGLMKGVEKLDPKKTQKEARSYLREKIRGAITEALTKQAKTVRLPSHIVKGIAKVRKATRELQGLGITPTIEALAAHLGIEPDIVAQLLSDGRRPVQLDAPIEVGAETRYEDIIPDESGWNNPLTCASENSLHERLMLALDRLEDGERQVVEQFFGLQSDKPMNLREIGDAIGRVRETARSTKNKALIKLRLTLDDEPSRDNFFQKAREQALRARELGLIRTSARGVNRQAKILAQKRPPELVQQERALCFSGQSFDLTPGLRTLPNPIRTEEQYSQYLSALARDLVEFPLHIELFRGYCTFRYIPSRSLGRARMWNIAIGDHAYGQRGKSFVRLGTFLTPMVHFKSTCAGGPPVSSLAESDFGANTITPFIHQVLDDIEQLTKMMIKDKEKR